MIHRKASFKCWLLYEYFAVRHNLYYMLWGKQHVKTSVSCKHLCSAAHIHKWTCEWRQQSCHKAWASTVTWPQLSPQQRPPGQACGPESCLQTSSHTVTVLQGPEKKLNLCVGGVFLRSFSSTSNTVLRYVNSHEAQSRWHREMRSLPPPVLLLQQAESEWI